MMATTSTVDQNRTTFRAMAATKKGGKFEMMEFERPVLKPNEIRVRVQCCGLCHTDLHNLYNDWGMSEYPYVPGHEWVGTVIETGVAVPEEHCRVGDRVGGGFLKSVCGVCEMCESGSNNHCEKMQQVFLQGNKGGMAEEVVVQSACCFKIPAEIRSEDAGPLMCAGVTVWNGLMSFGAKPGERVAVMGLGGLGSVAVKMASMFGCYVYVVSHTEEKREDALALGANEFINYTNAEELAKITNKIDVMLVITHDARDWNDYAEKFLKVNGRMVIIGFVEKDMKFNAMPLILKRIIIGGSNIGSRDDTKRMLRFSADHNLTVPTEMFAMSDINEALSRLKNNEMRYRAVLVADFDQFGTTASTSTSS